MSGKRTLSTFCLFCLGALLIGWQSLPYPMVYDDLHLIRHFTGQEIRSVFRGNWDVDGVETDGFRPFTVLFNHGRYHAFGENVVGHRLLLLALYATFLTALTWLALRIGVTWGAAIAAGLLCIWSVHSVFHYAWITDGNHTLQGVWIALSGVALTRGLETLRKSLFVLSVTLLVAAILVREDSLAAAPALTVLGLVRAADRGDRRSFKALLAWAVATGAAGVALLLVRRLVVPDAPHPGANWVAFGRTLIRVLHPMGVKSFDDASMAAMIGWRIMLGTLAGLLLLSTWRRLRAGEAPPRSWVWFASLLSACTFALTNSRQDLYFLASAFASLLIATAVVDIARDFPWFRLAGGLFLGWALVSGAYASRAMAYNFHPWSDTALWMNGEFLYERYVDAPMPPERRQAAADRLAAVGIRRRGTLRRLLPVLAAEARAADRREPTREGVVFVPRLRLNFSSTE